jgi:cell wall-associated NlpC family hydrolase
VFPLGFISVATALFLLDCAVTNRSPVAVLRAVATDPKNLRSTLADTKGTGYVSTFDLGSVLGQASGVVNKAVSDASGGSVAGRAALAYAFQQIGKPYQWGATGPNTFDCSGLVYRSFRDGAGVKIPRTTAGQILIGKRVSKANLEPGDLVFPDPGHVQLYAGGGMVVEAPHTGLKVREVPMWGFLTARRVGA